VEALTISSEYPGKIDALLTDMKMPRMEGRELIERIIQDRPNLKILVMSGQIDDPLIRGTSFLRKPFVPSTLRERMRQILSETVGN
jgi:CheY-like chemotaxis protein